MKKMRAALVIVVALVIAVVIVFAFGLLDRGGPEKLDRRWADPPEEAMTVLLVGNSHTFTHDVPGIVHHLASSQDRRIWVDSTAPPGMSLSQHADRKKTRRHIGSRDWDVVVLQNSSVTPASETESFVRAVERLAAQVRNRGARPILYGTWTQAKWHEMYKQEAFPWEPSSLRDALTGAYRRVEKVEAVEVAPVVSAFETYRLRSPEVRLHSSDGNHATPEGAYLAACVVYRRITGKPVESADFAPYGIQPKVAAALRKVADRSVRQWDAAKPESESRKNRARPRPDAGSTGDSGDTRPVRSPALR